MKIKETLKGLIFKKKPAMVVAGITHSSSAAADPNPYLNARRTWNDRSRSLLTAAQAGWVVGILGMLLALAGVGGIIHIGSQSKFVPYIVEVDKLSNQNSYGPATRASATDLKVVASRLSSFIADSRMVTTDVKLQRDAVFRTYAMLAPEDAATQKMNEWMNGTKESSPFIRAATETVAIEIKSVMPQTNETWQIDWIETTRDRKGVLKSKPANWRALVTVYTAETSTQTTEEDMWKNPIRLFARDFTWSKQL